MGILTIFTDGGARGNPGPAAIAYVIKNSNQTILTSGAEKIGYTTNNVAEYRAVIKALTFLRDHPINEATGLIFKVDSLLVVNQIKGFYKIKDTKLFLLAQQVKILIQLIKLPFSIQHISRNENYEADSLVNRVLDK